MTNGTENPRFLASLLRTSVDGFAGMAASQLFEDASSDELSKGDFLAWKGHLRRQILELAAAVEDESPGRFAAHLAWTRDAFTSRGESHEVLRASLHCLGEELERGLPGNCGPLLKHYLDVAEAELDRKPPDRPSTLSVTDPHQKLAQAFVNALRAGQEREAVGCILDPVQGGELLVADALESVLAPAMREIGHLWHRGEISVAEEHFATAATRRVIPGLLSQVSCAPSNGRCVILASVAGDSHDLGVQLVSAFFEIDGWRTLYLGADSPVDALGKLAREQSADLVALGATLDSQREAVVRAIAGLRELVPDQKILVGGGAFAGDEQLARRAGADAFACSPRQAVAAGRRLVGL